MERVQIAVRGPHAGMVNVILWDLNATFIRSLDTGEQIWEVDEPTFEEDEYVEWGLECGDVRYYGSSCTLSLQDDS